MLNAVVKILEMSQECIQARCTCQNALQTTQWPLGQDVEEAAEICGCTASAELAILTFAQRSTCNLFLFDSRASGSCMAGSKTIADYTEQSTAAAALLPLKSRCAACC